MNCSKLILAALSLVASPVVAQDRIDFAGNTLHHDIADAHAGCREAYIGDAQRIVF